MTERVPAEVFPPGEFIREELEARGWSQNDLADILDSYPRFVSEIITGKRAVTPETAKKLGAAFGTDPQLWMNLESSYRLWHAKGDSGDIGRKARIFAKAPVREMQRRGWIKGRLDVDGLESALKRFLGIASLDEEPPFLVAARRSNEDKPLTSTQIAWCAKARHLAAALQVAPFDSRRLDQVEKELRELAAYPKEARHLPKVLANYGIRFVVVEPLLGGKLDGVAFWLDESPAIAVSVRYDRIDNFWHTVLHEVSHIRHGDALIVDTEVLQGRSRLPIDPIEDRANYEAAATLVPPDELESLIRRLSPLYSANRIVQFANKIRMHPGIIVGQLQHREEVGYQALRSFLVKIRGVITATALTDGWGYTAEVGIP